MKDKPKSAWSYWPPADQWLNLLGPLVCALVGVIGLTAIPLYHFFSGLTGRQWIWCYGVAVVVAAVGLSLIFYAKLPLLIQRQYFTFGSRAIPENRRTFYRWGYRCVACAVMLLLCLLLPKP